MQYGGTYQYIAHSHTHPSITSKLVILTTFRFTSMVYPAITTCLPTKCTIAGVLTDNTGKKGSKLDPA